MDLYRFYDSKDQLLYVGISLSAAHRASKHKAEKPWWPDVARMEVQHVENDRRSALDIERDAIKNERPLHNVIHNGAAFCPPPKTTPQQTKLRLPVEYREVYAFALDDGSCPVGYVSEVWVPDEHYPDFQIEIQLYNWMIGMFTAGEMTFGWKHVIKTLKADKWVSDGSRHNGWYHEKGMTIYEMDPLGEFQTRVSP